MAFCLLKSHPFFFKRHGGEGELFGGLALKVSWCSPWGGLKAIDDPTNANVIVIIDRKSPQGSQLVSDYAAYPDQPMARAGAEQ